MTEAVHSDRVVHSLTVLDRTGDTKTLWDPTRPDEVALARETFEQLRKKGYLAYRVIGDGSKGEQMREFDPQAAAIILTPQLIGG